MKNFTKNELTQQQQSKVVEFINSRLDCALRELMRAIHLQILYSVDDAVSDRDNMITDILNSLHNDDE